jgi:photosystem II stability/assembly factor-like uncharacterized protein
MIRSAIRLITVFSLHSKSQVRAFLTALLIFLPGTTLLATTWFPFGPDGGDARAFAADPHDHTHLYLGTTVGWIYDSHDGGKSWKRLARIGNRDDLALDNILVDPANSKHVVIGAWVLGSTDGGLFISHDGGATWAGSNELKHQSIRALAYAPSDSKVMIAGTLSGVYRSEDSGEHWKLISPEGSKEIHEVESIAVDPTDPKIIYAGTWHLPWKTTDGGEHWHNIKQGIIEDSDVFSIIVDPKEPKTVYASACSGIYKSDDGGEKFLKVQGIPSTARRTRVLMQDPEHLQTVFAGTTEGLFRTDDAGSYWAPMTSNDVIVNDVYVDPADSHHVLMATDRGGVLASMDGGTSFFPSNTGFSARQVTSLTSDPHAPSNLYIGVVNDKQWGGAFFSTDGGFNWVQHAEGLEGRSVFSLAESADGTLVAGTEHGIYWYDRKGQIWMRGGEIGTAASERRPALKARPAPHKSGRPASAVENKPAMASAAGRIEVGVSSLTRIGDVLYAVTTEGVYGAEKPMGRWHLVDGPTAEPWRYLASAQSAALLASLRSLTLTTDGGKTWHMISLPPQLTQVGGVAVDDSGQLWVGGREGLYFSTDEGRGWSELKTLSISDVNNVFFDVRNQRILVTTNGSSTMAFAIHVPDKAVKYWDTGWNLRFMRPVGDYLIGATMFDGMVVQPRMMQSKELASH